MSGRPNSEDDKATVISSTKRRGFFSRWKADAKDENGDDEKGDVGSASQDKPEAPKVSFLELFRFSTKFELALDIIGAMAAAGAGAAQPFLALVFGNLTQDFVAFGNVVSEINAGNVSAQAQLPQAAANFRRIAAHDASILVYIGVGIFFLTFVSMYAWVYTSEVNAKRIRELYLKAVLRQNIAFFDDVGPGEVATRIQNDTHLVQQAISEKIALIMSATGAFFSAFIIAYARSWRLALALSSMLPCIVITGAVMNKFVVALSQVSLDHVAEGGTTAEEVISSVRTAQAFGIQNVLATLYETYIGKAHVCDLKAAAWRGGIYGVFFFIIYGGYGLAFSFGTTLINHNEGNPGDVLAVMLAVLIGSFSLGLLGPDIQAISTGRGAAAKLFATIDRVPDIDSADPSGLKPDHVDGEIRLENVNFNYPSRPSIRVVKDLSLTFRAGKTVALVGASGSGKSTIISLVERFYDPTSGAVTLDGHNLKDLNLKWLRSQIGLVSQEPTLFSATIKGNVEHGLIGTKLEHLSEDEKFALIKEACIKANADGFISKLPLGYDTMVGERGFLLSGGQKQRIAIARAIVSDPRILLLDEATSALDTQSEGVVQDALDKAAAGRTTITIAHRLSTIKDADVIYVMGDGLVVEQGTHSELIAADGAYARLVQAQKLREGRQLSGSTSGYTETGPEDSKEPVGEELPLVRKNSGRSLSSDVMTKKVIPEDDEDFGLPTLFKRIGLLVRDQWMRYLIGSIFASMTGMVYPAFGLVYGKGIQGLSLTDLAARKEAGNRTALWLFLIAILSMVAIAMQTYLFSAAAATLTYRLRSLSFRALLKQDIAFFDRDENNTGNLTAALSENPQKVNGLAGTTLGTIVQSIATLIGGTVVGLAFAWKLSLVGLACTPLLLTTGYIRLHVVVLKDQKNKKAYNQSAQFACEAAGSIRTVAALTRENDCLDIYSEYLAVPLRQSKKHSFGSHVLYAFAQALQFFIIGLIFWYGSVLVSHLEYNTFHFFVSLMSTTFSAIQAGNVWGYVPDISSAKGAGSDIIKLLESEPEIDAESTDGQPVDSKSCRGHIRFDRIHFRYPVRPDVRVLRDLSLEVQPGTYVALVGASGSGKSTVIQLIERFYDPLAGEIYLDGKPISGLNVQEYRKELALVSQEPTLYAGTIRFNILLGAVKPASEVTQEELDNACRNANIYEFIKSLPDGFDTQVGGKGSQLSGGQKQRIAIARALLRNPKVLLLDEATSALDSNSEKVVQDALDQAAKGRTTIAIAHRLSTIQNADRIYFIKDGRVSESGTHDQLLAKRGDYYEHVQLQGLSK